MPNSHSFIFDKQVDNARSNLSMDNIRNTYSAIMEQHRIASKVDEPIVLCD